jgi:hypothetical protein
MDGGIAIGADGSEAKRPPILGLASRRSSTQEARAKSTRALIVREGQSSEGLKAAQAATIQRQSASSFRMSPAAAKPSSDPVTRARQLMEQHMALAGEADPLQPPSATPDI